MTGVELQRDGAAGSLMAVAGSIALRVGALGAGGRAGLVSGRARRDRQSRSAACGSGKRSRRGSSLSSGARSLVIPNRAVAWIAGQPTVFVVLTGITLCRAPRWLPSGVTTATRPAKVQVGHSRPASNIVSDGVRTLKRRVLPVASSLRAGVRGSTSAARPREASRYRPPVTAKQARRAPSRSLIAARFLCVVVLLLLARVALVECGASLAPKGALPTPQQPQDAANTARPAGASGPRTARLRRSVRRRLLPDLAGSVHLTLGIPRDADPSDDRLLW